MSQAPEKIIQLRRAYTNAVHALRIAQQEERAAREQLACAVWGDGYTFEGTQTHVCLDGVEIKGQIAYRHTVSVDEATLEAALEQLPAHIEDRLVKFEPKVSVGEFKKLSAAHLAIIEDCITITPGLIQIKVT